MTKLYKCANIQHSSQIRDEKRRDYSRKNGLFTLKGSTGMDGKESGSVLTYDTTVGQQYDGRDYVVVRPRVGQLVYNTGFTRESTRRSGRCSLFLTADRKGGIWVDGEYPPFIPGITPGLRQWGNDDGERHKQWDAIVPKIESGELPEPEFIGISSDHPCMEIRWCERLWRKPFQSCPGVGHNWVSTGSKWRPVGDWQEVTHPAEA